MTSRPLYPLLLAVYAVLFLYAGNISAVSFGDVLPTLITVIVITAVTLLLASLLLRGAHRGALVTAALVVAFLGFGHAERLLAPLRIEAELQAVGWAALVGLALLIALRAASNLPRLSHVLNVMGLVLVLIPLITIVPYEVSRATRGSVQSAPTDVAPDGELPGTQRDIYYIVLDRYGSDWTLQYQFGIENDLTPWLVEHGFQVALGAHANYRATDVSLAATLNMRYLDDLTRVYGTETADRTPARDLVRSHAAGRFLQAQGYRYIQLGSWFDATLRSDIADEVLVWHPDSEFDSVFRETTALPRIDRALGISRSVSFRDKHRESALYQFETIAEVARQPGPKFVFAHILLPHPPYVFKADGSPLSESESATRSETELYANHLAVANRHLKQALATLLDGPEETDPIIIVQADEGPYLRTDIDWSDKPAERLQVRFGILSAFFLPGAAGVVIPQDITSVNTFRLLFSTYLGADLAPLPDRHFTWPEDRAYDFQEVTEQVHRLPDSEPLPPQGPPGE